jgi:hypothetical protein
MTNHVHLLFDPSDDVKSIGLLMKRLAGRQTRMSTIQDHCVRIVIKAWGHVLLLAFSQIVSPHSYQCLRPISNGSCGHKVRIRCSYSNDGFQIAVVNICPCNWCFRHLAAIKNSFLACALLELLSLKKPLIIYLYTGQSLSLNTCGSIPTRYFIAIPDKSC